MHQPYGAPLRQEVPLLIERGVQVTSARFVVYQQTYPIGGITSVSPFSIPAKKVGPVLLILFGAFLSIGPFVRLLWEGRIDGIVPLFITLSFTAAGVAWFYSRKPAHGVVITTAGMNVRALVSPDLAFVQRVVGALNHALASR